MPGLLRLQLAWLHLLMCTPLLQGILGLYTRLATCVDGSGVRPTVAPDVQVTWFYRPEEVYGGRKVEAYSAGA